MIFFYIMGAFVSVFCLLKKKTMRKSALLLLTGSVVSSFLWMVSLMKEDDMALREIRRQDKDGKETVVELEADAEGEKKTIRMRVGSQAYSREELRRLSENLLDELERKITGNGGTLDCVTEDMYFPEYMEGYPFHLEWSTDNLKLLSSDGKIGSEVPKEGILVEIRLKISNTESKFEAEHVFYAALFPQKSGVAFWERLEGLLEKQEMSTRGADTYILPESFEGKKLIFLEKKSDQSGTYFFLFLVGAVCIAVGQQQDDKKKKQERTRELTREYPEMVSRMTMLIGAGMTISGAFKRIAGEYGRRRQQTEKPLYEELMITCREMEAGIPEATAYRNLGTRCRQPCMVRFSALLVQYTKSGTAGLKRALHEETGQALRERQERAKRKGEEAGTKLLLPMTMMLVLIMVLIMIPAFTSIGM